MIVSKHHEMQVKFDKNEHKLIMKYNTYKSAKMSRLVINIRVVKN